MTDFKDIIKKAWKDPEFKKRLLEHPEETLKQEGIKVKGKVKVLEEKEHTHYFLIPPSPANVNKLSDQELNNAIGGRKCSTMSEIPARQL